MRSVQPFSGFLWSRILVLWHLKSILTISKKLNFLEEILDSNSYREKDEYFPRTERYTHWVIYSPGKDEIVGLFLDSTGSVQANRALDRSEKLFKEYLCQYPGRSGNLR